MIFQPAYFSLGLQVAAASSWQLGAHGRNRLWTGHLPSPGGHSQTRPHSSDGNTLGLLTHLACTCLGHGQ